MGDGAGEEHNHHLIYDQIVAMGASLKVAIVGAGVGGLTAAIALRAQGHRLHRVRAGAPPQRDGRLTSART